MKRKNAHLSMRKTMKVCSVLTTGFEFDDSIFTTIREAEFDAIPPPQDGLLLANQEHLGARPKQKNRRGRMSRARAYAKWVSQQQAGHLACEATANLSTAYTTAGRYQHKRKLRNRNPMASSSI
jgi:hypothetical protein